MLNRRQRILISLTFIGAVEWIALTAINAAIEGTVQFNVLRWVGFIALVWLMVDVVRETWAGRRQEERD